MQGRRALSEVFGGHQKGTYSSPGLLWHVAGGQGQHALDAQVQANWYVGEPEGLFIVASEQVQGVVPAIPTATNIAMQQGQGHRRGTWTAVGETARPPSYKGQ